LRNEVRFVVDELERGTEVARFFGETTFDAFSSIIPSIETGNQALNRFLNTLVEAVAQAALLGQGPLAGLFGGLGGAAGGGLLGSIFGFGGPIVSAGIGLFQQGGVTDRPAIFGEHGPEAAVPLPDGRRIPVEMRAPAMPAMMPPAPVTIRVEPSKYFDVVVDERAAAAAVPVAVRVTREGLYQAEQRRQRFERTGG
jgi:hypothetical protein